MGSLASGSLAPVASSGDPLSVSLTASSSQETLLRITETATPAGGNGSYTYAWTLHDPTGTARTALLSSSTVAAPTWTPDAIGGVWVATCAVTSNGVTVTTSRRQLIGGVRGFVSVLDLDFAQQADQSLSGGTLTVANRSQQGSPNETLTAYNDGSAATFAISASRLTIACNASTEIAASASAQAAPGFKLALGTVLTGYAATLNRDCAVLVAIKHDAVTFPNTNDAIACGLSGTTGPGESAATGNGLIGGLLKQAGGVRPRGVTQAGSGRNANTTTTGAGNDATGSRTLVILFTGGTGFVLGWSTDATDIAALADCLGLVAPASVFANATIPIATAGASAGEWMLPSEWELRVYNGTSVASPGASWSIERIRVWVKGAV